MEFFERRRNKQIIKPYLCERCNGVIVKGIMTNSMAVHHGKECMCKKPQQK
jgi:hypothetical protein